MLHSFAVNDVYSKFKTIYLSRKVEGPMRGHDNIRGCGHPIPTPPHLSPSRIATVFKAHYTRYTDGEIDLKPYSTATCFANKFLKAHNSYIHMLYKR